MGHMCGRSKCGGNAGSEKGSESFPRRKARGGSSKHYGTTHKKARGRALGRKGNETTPMEGLATHWFLVARPLARSSSFCLGHQPFTTGRLFFSNLSAISMMMLRHATKTPEFQRKSYQNGKRCVPFLILLDMVSACHLSKHTRSKKEKEQKKSAASRRFPPLCCNTL